MHRWRSRRFWTACLIAVAAVVTRARVSEAQLTRGFAKTIDAEATGEELSSQADFWALNVEFKPMRMIWVDLNDSATGKKPATGKKKRELIWYLVYRAVNPELRRRVDATDTTPVNTEDSPPVSFFIPEATLVTNDNGVQKIYQDVPLPQAQAAIIKRELRRGDSFQLKNSVEVVGQLPAAAPTGADSRKVIDGVLMWRGVDPKTDCFMVFLSGFSNGHRLVKGPTSFQKLRELVVAKQIHPSDAIWADRSVWKLTGEEVHVCELADLGKIKRVSKDEWDGRSNWKLASQLSGLFDQTKPPPFVADELDWYYTVTGDRLGANDKSPVWRRTLVQKFWRPSDRFEQDEREIRPLGSPMWIYRPEAPMPSAAKSAPEQPPAAPQ